MEETITLKEVCKWMDSGAPFSIAFVTNDDNRDTGGEWIEVDKAFKHDWMSKADKAKQAKAQPEVTAYSSRNPNHYTHSTRNISLPNGEIRKVHIRLIRRFNNKIVT